MSKLRILGIDCGSQVTGFGVIESDGRTHRSIAYGVIRTKTKDQFSERLRTIADGLDRVLSEHKPQEVAVEGVFHAVNTKTALKLAHVRGVALLSGARAGLNVSEYSPLEIKAGVVGYGRADKQQVRLMVQSLLGLRETVSPHDASDALAAAICHANTVAARRGRR